LYNAERKNVNIKNLKANRRIAKKDNWAKFKGELESGKKRLK
jgi:hypothetical protein